MSAARERGSPRAEGWPLITVSCERKRVSSVTLKSEMEIPSGVTGWPEGAKAGILIIH